MAWTSPPLFVPTQTPSAALFNVYLRDNLLETMAAKASTVGEIFVASGENEIDARLIDYEKLAGEVSSSENATFEDLNGPEVTVTTGPRALVLFGATLDCDGEGRAAMAYEVSGSTSIAANAAWSIQRPSSLLPDNPWTTGMADVRTDLNSGSNTFTAMYGSLNASTSHFTNRKLIVIPL